MRDERVDGEDPEPFPPGEDSPGGHGPPGDGETFPAGVESDEGERPDEKLDDGQPGLLEDPPRAD